MSWVGISRSCGGSHSDETSGNIHNEDQLGGSRMVLLIGGLLVGLGVGLGFASAMHMKSKSGGKPIDIADLVSYPAIILVGLGLMLILRAFDLLGEG